jgi:hypothetical protein
MEEDQSPRTSQKKKKIRALASVPAEIWIPPVCCVEEDKERSQVLLDLPGGGVKAPVFAQLSELVTEHNNFQQQP